MDVSKIKDVYINDLGCMRWREVGYPSSDKKFRKGGNAFIRGDTHITYEDAYWMGREQTELRILLNKHTEDKIEFSA